ncbi:DHA2 family efflux MFS transporter permease subunit [Conexibacter sp. CPCC 206217]|uniref:DHA2 family efflux MFS transporter permease subunit n=1 Tax=Conexibacter sp. CPCC 206217 TaxID=3064574 RepID=UPI00271D909D|nr:DHA2 family efflux MFS transporter permease subunit [Conexibacter sp. CPCC 206217]MDO8209091.1 DHA2 family efflux MFS transporter permease subunit [Conexibacter sp. CPCC 206217]
MAPARNRWLVLVAMTGSLSMIMLDQTVVTVALPSMGRDLPLSPTGQQWVVNAYVLAMAALVALGGKLGDKLGGVRTFRIGVAVFFLASMLCGLAPHGSLGEPWIISARVLQGAGAALMVPVSAAIVIGAFDVRERGRAMAVYTGISQVFLAVGPLLGGVLTESISWRTVFWLNVPVGIAALVMVHIARPDDSRQPGVRIAARSVVLLVGGIGTTVLAIQQASVWSWGSPATLLTLTAGLALTAWFVVGQLRATSPLVDVRLFARRAFLGNLVVLGLIQFALLAVILYSSIYLQELLHLSPISAGLGVLPLIVAIAAAAQLGGRWYDRGGVRPPALTGLAVATAGLAAWAASLPQLEYALQVPGMVLTGFGLGLIMSPTNTDALGRVTTAERSQASGLVQTVRQLGGTLGVAIIGTVVLGLEHRGAQVPTPHESADAITVGFACAAATFALALVAGWFLLSRERLDTGAQERSETLAAAAG